MLTPLRIIKSGGLRKGMRTVWGTQRTFYVHRKRFPLCRSDEMGERWRMVVVRGQGWLFTRCLAVPSISFSNSRCLKTSTAPLNLCSSSIHSKCLPCQYSPQLLPILEGECRKLLQNCPRLRRSGLPKHPPSGSVGYVCCDNLRMARIAVVHYASLHTRCSAVPALITWFLHCFSMICAGEIDRLDHLNPRF